MTDDDRARRVGENEALFRVVNERIEHLNRAFARLTETMDVVCECADIDCNDRLVLSLGDYERIRADPTRFVLVSGHQAPDVEDVVEHGDGWVVVQKHAGLPADVARENDPRSA